MNKSYQIKWYYPILVLIISLCCLFFYAKLQNPKEEQNRNVKEQNSITVVDPQNRQDTVFFGYVLGQPSKNLTERLIDEGNMDVEHRVSLTIRKGGVSQSIYVEGYPFDLYIADKKYMAFLSLFDTNGKKIGYQSDEKLMSQHIYICSTENAPVIEALKKQYGEPNALPEGGYESFVPEEDMDVFWNVSNKAVYLATLGNFMVLVYEDIIAVRDMKNAEKVEAEAEKEAERQRNMEQSKKMRL